MDELQQHWLLALSAPMVGINQEAGFTEPRFYGPDVSNGVDLDQSWGITDRASLLEMIERMTDHGHATRLATAYYDYAHQSPSQWRATLAGLSEHERVLYRYVERTAGECGDGGIRAWDLGRMGFLIRCGLLNGWIDTAESFWLQQRLALRAQYYYRSWAAYISGFLFGRVFWMYLDVAQPAELQACLTHAGGHPGNHSMIQHLCFHEQSPLRALPWGIDLPELDKPDSLQEFDWS